MLLPCPCILAKLPAAGICSSDSAETVAYLRGEVLSIPSEYRGWTLVTTDGLPLGWGKASGGQLKNHLPKGLRNPK